MAPLPLIEALSAIAVLRRVRPGRAAFL